MQEINNKNFSKLKKINSDLSYTKDNLDNLQKTINFKLFNSVKDKYSTFYGPKTFTKFPKKINLNSKRNNLLINTRKDKDNNYNINLKIQPKKDNNINAPNVALELNNFTKIKKISTNNQNNFSNYTNALFSFKKINKNKTHFNILSLDNSSKNLFQDIKNISNISFHKKINKKEVNKNNSFNSLDSNINSKNNTIYFNSSLDNFYFQNKSNRFNTKSPLDKMTQTKYSIFSPKSNCINFINDIMALYDKNGENKDNINESKDAEILRRALSNKKNLKNENGQNDINDNMEEIEDKKIYNMLGFDSFNQISLKSLFKKSAPKVKKCVLDNRIIEKKNINNNDFVLHPFSNSYGNLLDTLSEKVGFIKGSIDILYPKITQKKYQLRTKQRKKEFDMIKSKSIENSKKQKNDTRNNLYNINENKKVFQSIFTKYPINIKQNGIKLCFSKMYSFKGQRNLLLSKRINKNSSF